MPASGWTATVTVRRPTAESADRLARALVPEASREVPRARVRLERPDATTVEIRIQTRDTGALRAALNTHLGWMALAQATEEVAAAEALISRPR